jgi:hypothetical protein
VASTKFVSEGSPASSQILGGIDGGLQRALMRLRVDAMFCSRWRSCSQCPNKMRRRKKNP